MGTLLLEFLNFFTRNFGKRNPILDVRQKNLSIILDKLFWTDIVTRLCTFQLGLGWHF
jgi:hypothetical protein